MSAEIIEQKAIETIEARNLKIGQLGLIKDPRWESENGSIVLRTYTGVVILNDPSSTWGEECDTKVEPLKFGTSVKYTSEDYSGR